MYTHTRVHRVRVFIFLLNNFTYSFSFYYGKEDSVNFLNWMPTSSGFTLNYIFLLDVWVESEIRVNLFNREIENSAMAIYYEGSDG